jgi:putative acetyltransferase
MSYPTGINLQYPATPEQESEPRTPGFPQGIHAVIHVVIHVLIRVAMHIAMRGACALRAACYRASPTRSAAMPPFPRPADSPVARPVRDADGPAVAALIAAVFSEYEGCLFEPSEFPELAAPAIWIAGLRGRMWVVEARGAVIGCLAVRPVRGGRAAELHKVYLASGWRGRGLAAGLLEHACAAAAEWGCGALELWSDTRFRDGHRFYERHGFRRLPGLRALGDVSDTFEYAFRRDLDAGTPAR